MRHRPEKGFPGVVEARGEGILGSKPVSARESDTMDSWGIIFAKGGFSKTRLIDALREYEGLLTCSRW
jgi:hypothetical protein